MWNGFVNALNTQIGQIEKFRRILRILCPVQCAAESADHAGADEVGIAENQRIDALRLGAIAQRQDIGAIEIRGLITPRFQVTAKQRVFLTGLVIRPADGDVFVDLRPSSESHFAAGI